MKKQNKKYALIAIIMAIIFAFGALGRDNETLKKLAENSKFAESLLTYETGLNFFNIFEPIKQVISESNFIPQILNKEEKDEKEEFKPIKTEKTLLSSTSDIKNGTSYTIDPEEIAKEPFNLGIDFESDKPQVLLVCTHATESYAKGETDNYEETSEARTLNNEYNVVKIASILARKLTDSGINTVYSDKAHDYPSYTGSYDASRETIKQYIEKYPSIKIVIDVHRDAILKDDGTHLKAICTIDDKEYAQLMMVLGTNDGGLTHDNWKSNLGFALNLQNTISSEYCDFLRTINLRTSRFNQDLGDFAFLLEVGTSGNTLEEAKHSIELFGEEFAQFIKDNN